jgi:transposase InsO family protein
VNIDEPEIALFEAQRRVLKIQAKLHRRARDDSHRRFDDLFNWVLWFNQSRLHSALGHVPPVEFEEAHNRQINPERQPLAGRTRPPLNPGRFKVTSH